MDIVLETGLSAKVEPGVVMVAGTKDCSGLFYIRTTPILRNAVA
jgi:hypothetical protein